MSECKALIEARREYLGAWPSGAPVEGWASEALNLTVRLLAQYVLHLEGEVESLRGKVNSGRSNRESMEGLPEGTLPRV